MTSNTLKTRIRSKIDYLANWNSKSTFIPLLGEICIAIIPRNIDATRSQDIGVGVDTNNIGVKDREGAPRVGVGLTPYAIGIKVGDGINNFATLPWIQALAGDIYAWAKEATPPAASTIPATYGNNSNIDTVQEALNEIYSSLGNIVAGNVDPNTLSSALEALQEQLSGGGEQTLFTSNLYNDPEQEGGDPIRQYPTKIVRSIVKDGLTITVEGDNLVEADLPNIHVNKISDFATTAGYNASTNPLTTKGYVDAEITTLRSQITGGMVFLGIVYESDLPQNTAITDGVVVAPVIRIDENTTNSVSIANLRAGDIILYRETITTTDPETGNEVITAAPIGKEFVWTGGAWELLGDEGSYAVKGSILKADLSANLRNELDGKLDAATAATTYVAQNGDDSLMSAAEHAKLSGIENGAEANILEGVRVNGVSQTITNKEVDIEVPSISVNGTTQTPDNSHNIDISVPILKIKSQPVTGSATEVTPDSTDKSVTFAAIAFDGEVRNLKQTDTTYLILDCGDANQNLYDVT